jgi:hypothetical protein
MSKAADELDAISSPAQGAGTDTADPAGTAPAQTTVRKPVGRPRKDGSPPQSTRDPGYVPPPTGARKDKSAKTPPKPSVPRPAPPRDTSAADAAAEDARKAERRAFFAANESEIKRALGGLYGFPFEIAAAATSIPRMELDAEKKAERARTMYWVLCVYCPDWTKHLPLLVLGGAVAADAMGAFALYKAEKEAREAKSRTGVKSPDIVPPGPPLAAPAKTPETIEAKPL